MGHLLKFLVGIFALAAAVVPSAVASEHNWVVFPSTPDISVSSTATTVTFFGRGGRVPVQRVMIKNDCAENLYFGVLGEARSNSSDDAYIRLAQDNSVTITARNIYTVTASPHVNNTVTCTFTLVPMGH